MPYQNSTSVPMNSHHNVSYLPLILVVAAVLFNPALAIVNGSVMGLSSKHIILSEIMIVGLAQYYALTNLRREMLPWFFFMAVVGVFTVLRMAVTGEVEVKYFRDVLLIQTFIVLGMTTTPQRGKQAFMLICAFVVAGIFFEAVALKSYSNLFEIKQFYINTRGLVSDDFTTKGSNLYVSATRPGARTMPFFGLHRLSSIFLESVSLGNFMIISLCFTLAFWPMLGKKERIFMVFATLLALFASDGRLALFGASIILAISFFARFLPRNISLFILPVLILVTVLAVQGIGLYSGRDDFAGRLSYTIELLISMDFMDYMGLSNRLIETSADSGIVYLIITQSIVIVTLLWILIVTELKEQSPMQRHYKNGVTTYIALTMLVSFSFVSIKTAAPLWFIYGVLTTLSRKDIKFSH